MDSDNEVSGSDSENVWNNYLDFVKKIHLHKNLLESVQSDINVKITNLDKSIKLFVSNIAEMVEEIGNHHQNVMKLQGNRSEIKCSAARKKSKLKGYRKDLNPADHLSDVSSTAALNESNVLKLPKLDSTPQSLKRKSIYKKQALQTPDHSNIQNLEELDVAEISPLKKGATVLADVTISETYKKNDNKINEKVRNKKKSNKKNKSLSDINKKLGNGNLMDTPPSSRGLSSRKQNQSRGNVDDGICRKSPRISAHPPGYFQTKPHAVLFVEWANKKENVLTEQDSYIASSLEKLEGGSKKSFLPKEVATSNSSEMDGVESPTIPVNKNRKRERNGNKRTGRNRIGG